MWNVQVTSCNYIYNDLRLEMMSKYSLMRIQVLDQTQSVLNLPFVVLVTNLNSHHIIISPTQMNFHSTVQLFTLHCNLHCIHYVSYFVILLWSHPENARERPWLCGGNRLKQCPQIGWQYINGIKRKASSISLL